MASGKDDSILVVASALQQAIDNVIYRDTKLDNMAKKLQNGFRLSNFIVGHINSLDFLDDDKLIKHFIHWVLKNPKPGKSNTHNPTWQCSEERVVDYKKNSKVEKKTVRKSVWELSSHSSEKTGVPIVLGHLYWYIISQVNLRGTSNNNLPSTVQEQIKPVVIEVETTKQNKHMRMIFSSVVSESICAIINSLFRIRTEKIGKLASQVAAFPRVREALLRRQRAFKVSPGLVADGRDMGTVVFPDAALKIYLTASAEARAQRRYKQLKDKGMGVSLQALFLSIQARDEQDMNRSVAPLKPAADALIIDSTEMGLEEVFDTVLAAAQARLG